MNKEQLNLLINKLEEISKDLSDAVKENSDSKKNLMVWQTNNELIDTIDALKNHEKEIEL